MYSSVERKAKELHDKRVNEKLATNLQLQLNNDADLARKKSVHAQL